MKNLFSLLVSVVLVAWAVTSLAAEGVDCKMTASFSSAGSIAAAVAREIGQTQTKIFLAIYGFDNPKLADDLAQLGKRGVSVKVKIDTAKSERKKETQIVALLKSAGVQVQAVAPGGRNHNKFAVIDGAKVLTGSYNWTLKAENNWENLLVIDCAELARMYEREWESIR